MAASFNINWSRFDGFSFQSLCNDLLVAENILITPFRPGPVADGGEDARLFEETVGNLTGRFRFQSKYHAPKPGKANISVLKKDILGTKGKKGELDKAEEAKLDHLIILTNVSFPGPKQLDEVLKLASDRSFQFHIWDETKIKSLLVKHPYVRFFHLEGPEFPMFVSPEHFFKEFLSDDPKYLINHKIQLTGRTAELELFDTFVASSKRVLRIYAPPTQGKSRLVLEFSHRGTLKDLGWKAVFVRAEGRDLTRHLQELNPHQKYVLFVEDAHQLKEKFAPFLDLLQRGPDTPEIKLVLTGRISLRHFIDERLLKVQPSDIETLTLSQLDREDILQILRGELPNINEIRLRDLVPFVKDSPLLAVTAARLIKNGKPLAELLRPGELRRRLFELPLMDLKKYCSGDVEQYRKFEDLLLVISAIQPIRLTHGELLTKISSFTGIPETEVLKLIDTLVSFGLLKKVGYKVRLMPEILSDIILHQNCITSDGKSTGIGEKISDEFFECSPEELLNNLADIGQLEPDRVKVDVLGKVFANLKKLVRSCDNYQRSQILEKLKVVAARRANDVLDIIEIILNKPQLQHSYYETHARALGKIPSLLGITANNPEYIEDALNILKRLALKEKVETFYSNEKPDVVIEEIVGYDVGKPFVIQDKALDVLYKWQKEGTESFSLAVRSLSPIFSSSVSYWRSTGASVRLGRVPFSVSGKLKKLRQKALSLLLDALCSHIKELQLEAIDTAMKIGRSGIGPSLPQKALARIQPVIDAERLAVLDVLEKLTKSPKIAFILQASIERLLWNWWISKNKAIAKRCLDILGQVQDSEEYRLFKVLYMPDCPSHIELGEARKHSFSQKKRNNFFFDARRNQRLESNEFLMELIDKINNKYATSTQWLELLVKFGKEAQPKSPGWRYGQLLFILSSKYPSTGFKLYNSHNGIPWGTYKSSILAGIRQGDQEIWDKHVDRILRNAAHVDEEEICNCIWAVHYTSLSDKELRFLKRFASHPSQKVRTAIAKCLVGYSKNDWYTCLEIACRLVDEEVSEEMLEDICDALVHNRPEGYAFAPAEAEKKIIDYLINIPRLDKFWCIEYIEKLSQKSPQVLFDLIEKRAQLGREVHGIAEMTQKASNQWKKRSDFTKLLETIFKWAAQNNEIGYYAREMLPNFGSLQDPLILNCIKQLIQTGDKDGITSSARIASAFPKDDKLYDLFADLMKFALIHGEETFSRVAGIFSSAIWTGDWTRSLGQPSDFHQNIIDQSERILKKGDLPRKVRKFFEAERNLAQRDIKDDLMRDEELFE